MQFKFENIYNVVYLFYNTELLLNEVNQFQLIKYFKLNVKKYYKKE